MPLILQGILESTYVQKQFVDKKTGEMRPARSYIQIREDAENGKVILYPLAVPDLAPYEAKKGHPVAVKVRAFAPNAQVQFAYVEGQ
jgi:hypothetical protein